MIKDFPDDFGVLDGSQDFHFAAASGALADVDIEYPLEESRPGHSFGLRLGLVIRFDDLELRRRFLFFGNDLFSIF